MCYGSESITQQQEQEDKSLHADVERAANDADSAAYHADTIMGMASAADGGGTVVSQDVPLTVGDDKEIPPSQQPQSDALKAAVAEADAIIAGYGFEKGSVGYRHVQSAAIAAADFLRRGIDPLIMASKEYVARPHNPRSDLVALANTEPHKFLGAVGALLVHAANTDPALLPEVSRIMDGIEKIQSAGAVVSRNTLTGVMDELASILN